MLIKLKNIKDRNCNCVTKKYQFLCKRRKYCMPSSHITGAVTGDMTGMNIISNQIWKENHSRLY